MVVLQNKDLQEDEEDRAKARTRKWLQIKNEFEEYRQRHLECMKRSRDNQNEEDRKKERERKIVSFENESEEDNNTWKDFECQELIRPRRTEKKNEKVKELALTMSLRKIKFRMTRSNKTEEYREKERERKIVNFQNESEEDKQQHLERFKGQGEREQMRIKKMKEIRNLQRQTERNSYITIK